MHDNSSTSKPLWTISQTVAWVLVILMVMEVLQLQLLLEKHTDRTTQIIMTHTESGLVSLGILGIKGLSPEVHILEAEFMIPAHATTR